MRDCAQPTIYCIAITNQYCLFLSNAHMYLMQAQEEPYTVGAYSLAGVVDALDGESPPTIINGEGVQRFEDHDEYETELLTMTSYQSGSIFAESFNELLERSLLDSE